MDLNTLHRYLRGVDERRDAIETTPWIREDQREACYEYLIDEALSALDQVPPDVIAESFEWYVIYNERGTVEEMHGNVRVPGACPGPASEGGSLL